MVGSLVRFQTKPGKRDEFLEIVRWSARLARESEPGTLRLDAWIVDGEPDHVYAYEVFRDQAAFEQHARNAAVQKFADLKDDLVEGWTVIAPLSECVASNVGD